MLRLLRKYNKIILAVFGTLLLITFLIPFAFDRLGQVAAQRGVKWAEVGGKKITTTDQASVHRELQVIQYWPVAGLGIVGQAPHWFLLTREAAQAGFIQSVDITRLTQQDGQLLSLGQFADPDLGFVLQTFAKWQGVNRMIDLYLDANKYSDTQLLASARRAFHSCNIQYVVVEAEVPDPPLAFTDDELRAQMTSFADVAPGEGEMGFGYRLPDRVMLEWITVGIDVVRDMLETSDQLDEVALRKHWRQNDIRLGEPKPGEPVPDNVREDLLEELTASTLDDIAKFGHDQLRLLQRSLDQRNGLFVVPSDWAGLSFATLREQLEQRFDLTLPEPRSMEDFLDETAVGELEGIGPATSDRFGREPTPLPTIVMALEQFGGDGTIPVQVGIAGPPLTDGDGNVYFYRITHAEAARPPRSLEEVREFVVEDLNRKARFTELAEQRARFEVDTIQRGLLTIAVEHDTKIQTGRVSPTDVTSLIVAQQLGQQAEPQPISIPQIGVNAELSDRIIDRAMSLPIATAVGDIDIAQRTLVVPVEDKLSVVIAEIVGNTPLTRESYRLYAGIGLAQLPLVTADLGDVSNPISETFGLLALAKRHDFHLADDRPLVAPEDAGLGPTTRP